MIYEALFIKMTSSLIKTSMDISLTKIVCYYHYITHFRHYQVQMTIVY